MPYLLYKGIVVLFIGQSLKGPTALKELLALLTKMINCMKHSHTNTIVSLIYHSRSLSTQLRSDEDHTMAKNMHTLTLMSIILE